jgi:hypothetical protein
MDHHPNDYREQFYKRQLDVCEQAWRGGNFPAVLDAMEYCAEANMPPPPWLIAASETLVSSLMLVRTGRGRFNSRQAVFDANQKHFERWDMVRDLMDRGKELYELSLHHAAEMRKRRSEFESCGISQQVLDEAERINDGGLSLDNAFARVSEWLTEHVSPKGNSESAVRYSYYLVESAIAEGHGAEFYIARFKPNRKSG